MYSKATTKKQGADFSAPCFLILFSIGSVKGWTVLSEGVIIGIYVERKYQYA